MHLGRGGNPGHVYRMENSLLENTSPEKDIGVIVQDTLKPSLHCAKAAAKANSVLGQISRAVMYRDSNTFVRLYLVYVRPVLEYCIQAVGPYSEADKLCLEKVQMRAVRMVSNLKRGTYEEKLKSLNLTIFKERRWRGDMIQTWRILSGKDMVEANIWFDMEADRPREGATRTRNALGHHAIRPREYKYRERGEFFTNRVVRSYNQLPNTVKQATTINEFKNTLDDYRGIPSRSGSRPTAPSVPSIR